LRFCRYRAAFFAYCFFSTVPEPLDTGVWMRLLYEHPANVQFDQRAQRVRARLPHLHRVQSTSALIAGSKTLQRCVNGDAHRLTAIVSHLGVMTVAPAVLMSAGRRCCRWGVDWRSVLTGQALYSCRRMPLSDTDFGCPVTALRSMLRLGRGSEQRCWAPW